MADQARGRGRGRGRGRNRGRSQDRGRGQGRGFLYNGSNPIGINGDQRSNFQKGYGPRYQNEGYTNRSVEGEVNAHLTERFKGRSRGNNEGWLFEDNPPRRTSANPAIAKYIHDQLTITDSFANSNNWLSTPEIPSRDEISPPDGAEVALPANRMGSPFSKPISYLKTHYKLLREDAISPLREAVGKFRKDPQRMDDHDMRIYEQVRVVGLTFTFKGIATRIKFSTARSNRKILWSASKRLTSGTLVALSPTKDEFQTQCILAIVAARPLQNLEVSPPEIDLFFGHADHQEIDPQSSFLMVEASQGYFEAYRHTLLALQKQSQEAFPLADHICRLNHQVDPPQYLVENPLINMTPAAADNETRSLFKTVDVLNNWPSAPSAILDRTQWDAMRDILTKKLAIIQGPPGTGKTHVSTIAIKILLANRGVGDAPIIVACQTNHALDQLLQKIQEFEPGFIRLGGRSSSPSVKTRSLHEVRKKEVIEEIVGSCLSKARRDISLQTMKLKSYLSPTLENSTSIISADIFFERGIINESQLESLKKGADQWMRSDNSDADPLEVWLGKAIVPFVPIYNDDSFGFEEAEEDLEVEQLRELEAETGVADEEDVELLKGDYVSFNMGMTMSQPTPQTLDQAKRMLDTMKDLYRVPEHLRGPMYLVMQEKLKQITRSELREQIQTYDRCATQIRIGRWEKDAAYLSKAPIIGMTTTGLSKYRALVSALKPKIALIEEAAEVLEGPVSVACVESLQHLILVGDHQQLQATCSVKGLEGEPFYLNVSMFERLFRGGMPYKSLLCQRRMAPEIRGLIAKSYPNLADHDTVITRARPQLGMGTVSTWFLNHDWQELQDEHMSTYNEQEARLVAKFYRHLVRNGVPASCITVLTFYNGQRKKILKELKSEPETASIYNKVKTVDSYQGEENTVIILSLVRNNESGKIGFLDINNRVVVALSRAKFGLYFFGNSGFLADKNELWDYVEEYMYRAGRSDRRMPLTCANHGNTVWVQNPEDFDQLNGGCHVKCDGTLLCGHYCPLKCHTYPHDRVVCHLPCTKELVCGHFCSKTCKDKCKCDCEVYRRHEEKEEEADVDPVSVEPDPRGEQNDFATQKLTEENLSKLPQQKECDARAHMGVAAEEENSPELGRIARSLIEGEREHVIGNGRVQRVHQWQPRLQELEQLSQVTLGEENTDIHLSVREGKKPELSIPPARHLHASEFDGGSDSTDIRHSVREGKKPELPTPPARQLHASGFGGGNDSNVSGPDWDGEAALEDETVTEWYDAETVEWERQQRGIRGDSFW